jgi:hypothetical protein
MLMLLLLPKSCFGTMLYLDEFGTSPDLSIHALHVFGTELQFQADYNGARHILSIFRPVVGSELIWTTQDPGLIWQSG